MTVGDALPPFDLWCPLLSLPHLFGMQAPVPPYLAADADRVAAWRDRIGTHGRRIGIAWQGNPASRRRDEAARSRWRVPPLAQVPGVRLISLQKHHGLEQLAAVPDGLRIETLGDDFDAGPDAFIDTAAVMQCLDLVITSDTSVAHLAGALGRPVWVGSAARARLALAARGRGLPLVSDHAAVPADEARRLGRRVRPDGGTADDPKRAGLLGRTDRQDHASWRSRSERLRAPAAQANAAHELALLRAVLAEHGGGPPGLAALRGELAAVNRRLWDIEDDIRRKEASQTFDAEFVELARAVYRNNDERSRIKRAINELLGSGDHRGEAVCRLPRH